MIDSMNMPLRSLGGTHIAVSALGLGAGRLGEPSVAEEQVERLVARALDLGVVLFDAARSYGLAEERLGRALAPVRERVLISTKVGYGVPGVPDWTGPCVEAGVDAALRRLRTDRLDLVHLHSCGAEVLRRGEVVEALSRAVQAGKVRVAAYSGEGDALDLAVRSGAFGAVQCSVSALDQASLGGAVAEAARRGLGVLAKRPLADAPWRFAARPEAGDVAVYWDRLRALGLDPAAPGLDALFLRFAAFSPGVSCALLGTASPAHLERAAAAVAEGPLPDAARQELTAAFARVGNGWPGQV
jgi:aryl-alcohol dehydrogenase-like predicted oxidoreductase